MIYVHALQSRTVLNYNSVTRARDKRIMVKKKNAKASSMWSICCSTRTRWTDQTLPVHRFTSRLQVHSQVGATVWRQKQPPHTLHLQLAIASMFNLPRRKIVQRVGLPPTYVGLLCIRNWRTLLHMRRADAARAVTRWQHFSA